MATINLAPTANAAVSIYREILKDGKRRPDATYAIALLAVAQGYGDVTLDRLSVSLEIAD
jgi:hypothetical protein